MVSNTLTLETMAPLSTMLVVLMIAVTSMAADWQANPNDCGKTLHQGMNTMIVGGRPAEEYAWPWQVAMLENGGFICGGSLIDPWWVLTAAHCVDTSLLSKPEAYTFRVGSIDLYENTTVTQERKALKIIVHPRYNITVNKNYDNDIALFKMKEPFTLSKDFKVNTICIPTGEMEDQFVVGQEATVTGWGTISNGSSPNTLYEAVVPIYNWTKCNQSLELVVGKGALTDNMICAGFEAGGVDPCKGDSGGPLVTYPSSNTDQYFQIGIVSWGSTDPCAKPHYPGVYTRVTRYENWIRSYVRDQKMSLWTKAAISVIFVLRVIFIGIIVALGIYMYRQKKIGPKRESNENDPLLGKDTVLHDE